MEDEYDFHRARSIPERISPAEELRPYSQDDGLARVELLGDTRFGERRNGSVRAATMQQMQHVVGNHSLQRYVQRQHAQGGSAPVVKGAGSDVPEWLMKQVVDTGIARPEITKEYNKAVGALFEKWNTMDETQRLAHLGSIANRMLGQAGRGKSKGKVKGGVPQVGLVSMDLKGPKGQFDPQDWTLNIDKKLLQGKATREELNKLAEVVLHETRHAEQEYRQARWALTKGNVKGAEDIRGLRALKAGMDKDVLKRAAANPLKLASQAELKKMSPWKRVEEEKVVEEGKTWFQSQWGHGSAHMDKTLDAVSKQHAALDAAREEMDRARTAEARQAAKAKLDRVYADWKRIYKQYRALPMEADAFATGGAAMPEAPMPELTDVLQ